MEQNRREGDKKMQDLTNMVTSHIKDEEAKFSVYERVLFGDKQLGEIGMKDKVDEMHDILIASRNVTGFFGKIGGFGKWVFVIVGLVGLLKGWWFALFIATSNILNK